MAAVDDGRWSERNRRTVECRVALPWQSFGWSASIERGSTFPGVPRYGLDAVSGGGRAGSAVRHGQVYYANTRTMACTFEFVLIDLHELTTPVVLVYMFTKRHRTLLLARPRLEASVLTTWIENARQLYVVYYSKTVENGERRAECHHVRYEIPANDAEIDETGIQPRSWQSIAFPRGTRNWACVHVHHKPPAVVIGRHIAPGLDPTNLRVLVFDLSLGTWRMVTPDQWMVMLREDDASWNVIRAAEAIRPLSLRTPQQCRCIRPISNLLKHLCPSVDSTGSVFYSDRNAVLQFASKPPSLKRLAAESLCTGNRAFNRAELKNAIGFDIFDGMVQANDQPNHPVIFV